ncbi:hypothetical protein Poli38472_006965 [Pythium oligandrum]|uniref:Uncharacterized protein n=1 Tax=Pythium oligandrum TaxID=41045 RepID=A0A8K1C9L7_PYTOL|nr:hypothetical protein Poli38472_006965 [Pythium oligandrum]|eukprot:TMW58820.1 hypothetical protein Poli38472_006965 [Pythium oligandrum]
MPTMNKAIAPLRKSNRISPTRTESTQQIPVPSIVRYINLLYDKFVNLDDFLGANGRHFDSVFAVLEVLEMAPQTYQAYHLSCSVKAAWINHFAVSVVVLRALTTSLSHGLTRGKRGRRRLFVLVFDMWLDFACVVIVPMFISYPYVVASFNWKQNGFDPRLIYNETWVASAIAEGRYVLVTSWIDLITSLIPHVGILSCLSMLKSLIFRCDESDVIQPSIAKQYPPPPVPVSATKRMRYIHKLLNIFVVGWGVAVLGIHVIAQRAMNNSIPPCKLILGAWFVTNVSCAVIQFNCYRLGYDGNAEFATTVLAQLERSIVVKITFAHCPALEIPDILNEFSRFYDMDIYNSTLVDWPASASINRDRHPKFDHLYLFATNMSAFPAGILHGALPSPFNKLAFYRTNLSVIPPSLGDHWSEQEWLVMYFEFNQITSIPDSFSQIRTNQLFINSNQITSLPDNLLEHMSLTHLHLSEPLLDHLPTIPPVGFSSKLKQLRVEHTHVSELPVWISTWPDKPLVVDASLYGSTVCQTPAFTSSDSHHAPYCTTDAHSDKGATSYWAYVAERPL